MAGRRISKKREKPALVIAVLLKKRGAIGGMAQRFSIVGSYLVERGYNFELLTTASVAEEFNLPSVKNSIILDDLKGSISLASWFTALWVIVRIMLARFGQVHLAGSGRLLKPVILAARLSGTRISCTFASRTLEMASYGREDDRNAWIQTLNSVHKIDVLNPGHDLHEWECKISVSPCSFPSKLNNLPEAFENNKKKLVVFCGAFERNKNPILAIDIVEEYIRATGDNVGIAMFGKGSLSGAVLDRISELNAKFQRPVASLLPPDKLGEYLSSANVFLSLQEIDNYPSQSVLEAMLMGCKIIATDVGDTKLLFPVGVPHNFAVASREPADFVQAMRVAFSDMSASADNVNFVKTVHTLERFSKYFIDFIDAR